MGKNIHAYGYLYGLAGGLISTFIFTFSHILLVVYRSGFEAYLKHWDYPKGIIVVGIIISIIPSGGMGVFFSFLLLRDLRKGKLRYKISILKGIYLGVMGILVVFGFILVTPFTSVVVRMGDVGLLYLLVAMVLSAGVGGATGVMLTKFILNNVKADLNIVEIA